MNNQVQSGWLLLSLNDLVVSHPHKFTAANLPNKEHARLLGITSIDEYIRYGGTLEVGELAFEDEELNVEEASFRDDELPDGILIPLSAKTFSTV